MRAKSIVKTILFGFVLYMVLDTLRVIGVFRDVANTNPNEKCRGIANTPAPETLRHYKDDIFFYTSSDNLKLFFTNLAADTPNGGVYAVFDAKTDNPRVEKLKIENFPENVAFHPFGFYVY